MTGNASKVLLPIDDSDCSQKAMQRVAHRLWSRGTNFLVVHVVSKSADEDFAANALADVSAQPTLPSRAERLVGDIVEYLRPQLGAGTSVQGRVVEGDVVQSIIDLSREFDAGLIIVGTHGRAGLQKFFLGSVAEGLLARAPCTVEVIRVP